MRTRLGLWQRRWFTVLFTGVVLFVASGQALRITGNPNFFPTVVLLGSFAVPAAFVTYFYEQERRLDRKLHSELSLGAVGSCFLVGGAVGLILAGILEWGAIQKLSLAGLAGVSVIEESTKLIFPLAVFWRGRYRSEMDGLLFGVASGMGFAALETMGYGLTVMVRSSGDVGALEEVLMIRGLFSPAGHAAWTGLICAVIWRQRLEGRGLFSVSVLGTVALAVILHSLWNATNVMDRAGVPSIVVAVLGNFVLAGVSLMLLVQRLREARSGSAMAEVRSGKTEDSRQ